METTRWEWPRCPTPEEIWALEQAARRERARVIAGLLAAAGRQLKQLVRSAGAALRTRVQYPTRNRPVTLFWKNALASLPPGLRDRYAPTFEAAERFEMLLDQGIEAWGSTKQVLAETYQAATHVKRRAAYLR